MEFTRHHKEQVHYSPTFFHWNTWVTLTKHVQVAPLPPTPGQAQKQSPYYITQHLTKTSRDFEHLHSSISYKHSNTYKLHNFSTSPIVENLSRYVTSNKTVCINCLIRFTGTRQICIN
jgi:hypothetical protein